MSATVDLINLKSRNKSYFLECCKDDLVNVMPIAKRMFDLGINVEISCNLDYVQRIEKIRACDVVLFFVSRRTFKAKKSGNTSEMYEDYDCCVNYDKTTLYIALNNIDTI